MITASASAINMDGHWHLAQQPGESCHIPCTNEQYHRNRSHDSSTGIRMVRESAARYYHTFVTGRIKPVTTKPMALGDLKHIAILQPDELDQLVKVIPDDVLAKDGSKSGSAWKHWAWENRGTLHAKQSEYDDALWARDSVWSNPTVAAFLKTSTVREHSIFWTNTKGYSLRARLDLANELDGEIGDIKNTAENESEFWRAVKKYGLDQQAALYQAAYRAAYGMRPSFWFVLISSEAPFECCLRQMPDDVLELGRKKNAESLRDLYEYKRGDRPWVRPDLLEKKPLEFPAFFYPATDDYPEA